ncbi:hypothetical protein RFI_09390 [Reticulomyxa filosa]|uniref:ATPase AAA-type core domain-containing protein n=1 Tax=Reticulomyxa filosa TaxID=46433 RepID=X6NNY5_RETFI|nr:hypothetical protein RFI_09390 [Reticulomyxa filosa]|eukprot:ETO27736.1 hypothetical protein RFI_09390 [Reticulomyxa filosa]
MYMYMCLCVTSISSDKSKWKKQGKETDNSATTDKSKSRGDESDSKGKEKKEVDKNDKALMDKLSDDMIIDKPNVFFREVIGLEMVKLALYENIILPQQRPDLFASVRKPCTGLLLFGPPGNGKTMIAKCGMCLIP